MINAALLKSIIRENNYTVKSLSEQLGISESTLRRRLSGRSAFTVKEVGRLEVLLGLTKRQMEEIFFTDSVADRQRP